MPLSPKIRAALQRTRAARAKINKRIGDPHGDQKESAEIPLTAQREVPKLEVRQLDGTESHPGDDPVQAVDRNDSPTIPARQRRNPGRRPRDP